MKLGNALEMDGYGDEMDEFWFLGLIEGQYFGG